MNICGRILVLVGLLLAPVWLSAAEPTGSEAASAKLTAATVTLRIAPAAEESTKEVGKETTKNALPEVVVCTAVSLGKGQLVTFYNKPGNARYRVTLPDGEQAEAAPRVVDSFSGLKLLEIKNATLPGLEIADSLPAVGGTVLTAAASGLEGPAVSLGILGGLDRSLPGVDLPLLAQCDVRTTETSAGAALVDKTGKLIGIVAATSAPGEKAGWTYAIPAKHLLRLQQAAQPGKVIELKRQRPVAGLTVGPGEKEGTVRVERIEPNGPAEKAGVQVGDLVVEAEGRKIRSAYQAVDLILKKQPGETIDFVVQQGEKSREVKLTLSGASSTSIASNGNASGVVVGPQVTLRKSADGVEVRNVGVQELSTEAPRVRRSPGDEVELLKTQLAGFEQVIQKLQAELQRRNELLLDTEKRMQTLQREVEQLRTERTAPAEKR